jgi:hypothetical protein
MARRPGCPQGSRGVAEKPVATTGPLINSNSFGRYLSRPYIVHIARIGLVLGRERQRDIARSRLTAREVAVAPSLRLEINPVVFTIVPQADGLYDVEASDGGASGFLVNFRTRVEAEAWITKLKGMTN